MLRAVTPETRFRLDRHALLVAAVALVAYLPGFWWGAPTATAADRVLAWGVDDSSPLGPLAEMDNILHPKPDRNLGYPLLHDFIVAGAYAPYLVALKATGGLRAVSAVYPFGLTHPVPVLRNLTLINHLVSVLLGVLCVVAAYDVGRTLWGPATGLGSAAFALTLYPMFYYARTGNVDVPMLAFLALTMAALARGLVHGMTVRRAVWIGVFAGLTLATKEAAVGALLPAAVLVLVLGWREGGWKVPALALAASVLALGAGSGLFVDPGRWLAHVQFISGRAQDVPNTTTINYVYPFTASGNAAFAAAIGERLMSAMSLPGVLLAAGATVAAAWKDRRAALFALAVPAYLAVEFVLLRAAQLRYVLPAAWLLALFGGWAVTAAWRSGRPVLRAGVAVVAAAALGLQLLNAASLTWEMLRDSRHAAGAWIAAHLRPGERVEFFGASQKIPPIPAGVASGMATPFHGMWSAYRTDAVMADSIRREWASRRPSLVIVIPDHSSRPGLPYDATVPPMLYDSLMAGTWGYRLAAFFRAPALVPWPKRPALDYPSVNPPIRFFVPADSSAPAAAPS